jgi:hypothetical protein
MIEVEGRCGANIYTPETGIGEKRIDFGRLGLSGNLTTYKKQGRLQDRFRPETAS